ncbi:hypothetical protein [Pseudomonas aeruginosa]
MSEAAKALSHYASNYRQPCTDDSDREFCRSAALAWAAAIIAGTE